jgi:uncharacterized pyridoxamine 5'-phosphate oxidase family protein
MNIKDLDFDTVSKEKLQLLEDVKEMVLSTCSGNHVTSRIVSTACRGTTIVFLSFGHNTKCVQIRENPNVALCWNNFQIEGSASIYEDFKEAENAGLMEIYKEKQPVYYESAPKLKGMLLVVVDIKLMIFNPPKTYFLDRIDFEKRTAFRGSMQEDD